MHCFKLVSLTAGVLLVSGPIFGQTAASLIESDLDKAVKESGLTPVDIGKFLRFNYRVETQESATKVSKPSSSVFIRKDVWEYQSLKVREMYGLVYEATEPPSTEKLVELFSTSFSIGGLQLEGPSDTQKYWRLRFRVEVPVNCSGKRFRWYADTVSLTADSIRAKHGFKIDEGFGTASFRGVK